MRAAALTERSPRKRDRRMFGGAGIRRELHFRNFTKPQDAHALMRPSPLGVQTPSVDRVRFSRIMSFEAVEERN